MRSLRRALAVLLILIMALSVASVILLALAGVTPDRGPEGTRRQIRRLVERNLRTVSKEIPHAEKGYYYDQLGKKGQSIYRVMYAGVTADEAEIEVPGSDLALIETVWGTLMADHPEFFWLTGSLRSTAHEPAVGKSYSVIRPERTCSREEAARRRREIERAAGRFLDQQKQGSSDYERIKAAYDYIISTTVYDDGAPDDQNIYSVFVGGRSVCAGYTRAFQYLMKCQGIPCLYVTGTNDKNSEPHAWNIVECGGHYYHVDVTWGDPVYSDPDDPLPEEMRITGYDYLCCTDAEIARTHTADEGLDLPACDAGDLNFYKIHGSYYDSYDPAQCRQAIFEDIDARHPVTIFKFADRKLYDQAREELTGELLKAGANRILVNTGMRQVYNYYQTDKTLNKIVLYWQYQ